MHILLVEDDEIDAEAVMRGFRQHGFAPPLTRARNGREALQLLRSPTAQTGLTQPCLIMTDLNMPLMNGLEFLQALRRDPTLRRAVVFVLSGTPLAEDKSAAYAHGAAGYLLKAHLATHFGELVQLLKCYQALVEWPGA